MINHDLHVVSFSVPYPPTYGGAMEVWNRLKALHREGVRIKLHCFVYGPYRPEAKLLEVAKEVHYYPRSMWPVLFTRGQSFAVSSRKHVQLLARLEKDDSPILFEGMQTTGWADALKARKRLLRAHNIEHLYYHQLSLNSSRVASLIYNRESQCLEEYEKARLQDFDMIFAISPPDLEWFNHHHAKATLLLPFHGFERPAIEPGQGNYLLYQGDLSLEINQRSVLELVNLLPDGETWPLVVVGRSGDRAFESKMTAFPNIRRETNVSEELMSKLIGQAHIIINHSLHGQGIKMKLFPSLFQGRFVMANAEGLTNSNLDEAIHFYTPSTFRDILHQLKNRTFTAADLEARKSILAHGPNDRSGAHQIIQHLS